MNEERAVIVTVVTGDSVERFELLISGIVADQQFSGRVAGENTYAAVLTARFEAAGAYDLVVRAVTTSGQIVMSEPVQVVAIPAVVETQPVGTTATVVADASLFTGPGADFNQAGRLEPGQVVTVMGRTADRQWLQVETGGGLWVRANAVDMEPSELDRVPVVSAPPPPPGAPTPPTGEEATGAASPTPSPTPPVSPNAPDFIPSNAVLIEGGSILRITLTNTSTNPFSGDVVVRVEEVNADPAEKVVNVTMDPSGAASVNFTIDPPITEQSSVTVTVDPDDAIAEFSEDNNQTRFVLAPPPEGPVLSLVAGITSGELCATIRNEGATLTTSDARLVVSVPGETTTRTVSTLSIAEEESSVICGISVPRTGEAITLTLFIDGIIVATATIPNPNVVEVPPDETAPDDETDPEETPATGDPQEPQEPGEPQEPDDS